LFGSHPILAAAGGQGWTQLGELALAFALSSLIGLEREWRQKSAGLRTHTLVGVGAALFEVRGKPSIEELAIALDKLDGVLGVETTDFADDSG